MYIGFNYERSSEGSEEKFINESAWQIFLIGVKEDLKPKECIVKVLQESMQQSNKVMMKI